MLILSFRTVKIKKQVPHLKWGQHTADPKRKRSNIAYLIGCDTTSPPKQEEEKIPPC